MPDINNLNNLDHEATMEALECCCGAKEWVAQLAAQKPFSDIASLYQAADEIWWSLTEADWREAFTHHPKIGDLDSLRAKFANTQTWASGEQAGVQGADEAVLQGLAEGNQAYEEKFGYIFIVCATGKSAAEMLALLQQRLPNDPQTEIKISAEEQRKITHIRLEKLLRNA